MGYPLYIAAVGAGYWVVRRVRHQLPVHVQDELADGEPGSDPDAGAPAVESAPSADDSAADRRFGLG
jgi:hypothetical protein